MPTTGAENVSLYKLEHDVRANIGGMSLVLQPQKFHDFFFPRVVNSQGHGRKLHCSMSKLKEHWTSTYVLTLQIYTTWNLERGTQVCKHCYG